MESDFINRWISQRLELATLVTVSWPISSTRCWKDLLRRLFRQECFNLEVNCIGLFFFFLNFKRNWNVQVESACQALPHHAMRSLPFPAPRTRWTWPSVDREKWPPSWIGWLSLPLPGSIQCHQYPFRPMRITPHQTDLDYLQSPLFLAVSFLVLLPPKSLRSDHICLSLF